MRSAIIGAAVDDLEQLKRLVAINTRITDTDPRAEHGALAVALPRDKPPKSTSWAGRLHRHFEATRCAGVVARASSTNAAGGIEC